MKWNTLKKSTPNHKDLVLIKQSNGLVIPAVYYNNNSFFGFYPFTTFYKNESIINEYYSKVDCKIKFDNIIKWVLIPD